MMPVGLSNLPVRWQDLIELSSAMPAAERAEFTQALDDMARSNAGQKLLRDLHKTQTMLRVFRHFDVEIGGSTHNEASRLADIAGQGRQQPDKVYIMSARPEQKELLAKLHGLGEASALPDQIIAFNLPAWKDQKLSMKDAAGKPIEAGQTLAAALMHELQHSVDVLETLIPPKIYSRACREERAVAAENRYKSEMHPNDPQRKVYDDSAQRFKVLLDSTNPEFSRQFHTHMDEYVAEALVKITRTFVHEGVKMNHGCHQVSESESWRETRAVLINAGISAENLQRLEQAVPELQGQLPSKPTGGNTARTP